MTQALVEIWALQCGVEMQVLATKNLVTNTSSPVAFMDPSRQAPAVLHPVTPIYRLYLIHIVHICTRMQEDLVPAHSGPIRFFTLASIFNVRIVILDSALWPASMAGGCNNDAGLEQLSRHANHGRRIREGNGTELTSGTVICPRYTRLDLA